MAELTREQADLLNAKLIIADLTMEIYRLRVEIYKASRPPEQKAKNVRSKR